MKRPVSSGRLADMAVCEVRAALKEKHKEAYPKNIRAQIKAGNTAHAKDEAAVKKLQSQVCYIATCVYGQDAIETNKFRQYRDTQLLTTSTGRCLIRVYYAISPLFVRLAERSPKLKAVTRLCLNRLVSRL